MLNTYLGDWKQAPALGGCGITPGGFREMAEKMGIEGLHSVGGEAVFAACLPISWFCPWAGSSVE